LSTVAYRGDFRGSYDSVDQTSQSLFVDEFFSSYMYAGCLYPSIYFSLKTKPNKHRTQKHRTLKDRERHENNNKNMQHTTVYVKPSNSCMKP